MSQKTYRVIQWATGTVGKIALQHYIENPTFEVVGVLVTNPDKVGKDAGELVGLPPIGVLATDDVEAILALDADAVHFAPMLQDVDMVCRLLRSGKNVVSMIGPFFPTEHNTENVDKIEAACQAGGTSFHSTGIHPGYVGDILPMTLTRLMDRIDRIQVFEIADKRVSPSVYIEFMGFGLEPDVLAARPNCMTGVMEQFMESAAMVITGLGKSFDRLEEKHEIAIATKDIEYPGGVIRKGTVAGQHWQWTGWVEGKELAVYHLYYRVGDDIDPAWNLGPSRHRIILEGNPNLEVTLQATEDENGERQFLGIIWTALLGANAVARVCDAAPGLLTHFDLGVVKPQGLIRAQ
jgi:hypothetical protein